MRLEGQTKRYKAIADACEEQEEILKQDRRKCQREVSFFCVWGFLSLVYFSPDKFSLLLAHVEGFF